ncbi:hypothetical protein BWI15_01385 [Kribbella sp. ALI-6-A]|uniref:YceI family protein n=1 Tax=Kribbella sp. ALI-6-A TaxID=1933817 RepID=UPI00097C1FF4|nr:YceI family protein [Kribbella sp. ALI-6-A]ONI78548.1 hypothetical protein BWI15_01385 [Kribbella sp. ALI-6-A]
MTQIVAQRLLADDATVGRWLLDSRATTVSLTQKTMWGMVTVECAFTQASGEGRIDPGGVVTGTLKIAAASIDSKHKKRDQHLRSADFFDVKQFPDIIVEVDSAAAVGSSLQLQAHITVKGVRKPVELVATVIESRVDAIVVEVEATIDRRRFRMSWNRMGMIKGLATISTRATFRRAN